MNMISTGAFLPEMDAFNKQETMAEKFARVWEKKNSKVARAGGVSLMALSLAACGSSDSGTAAVVAPEAPEEPEAPAPVTPVTPAGQTYTLTSDAESVFGTAGDDTFNATTATLQDADIIIDGSNTDNDVMNVTLTDDRDLTGATIVGIEEANFNLDAFTTTTGTTLAIDLGGVAAGNVSFDVIQAGSRVAALDLDEVRTGEVTLSSDFTSATITGNNNADLTIVSNVSGTTVFSLTEDGATTDDITVTSGGGLTLTNVDNDGAIIATAGDNITVTDADVAATLKATSTGGWIEVTTADAATSLDLTAAEDVDVAGATGATSVTISGTGTAADTALAADQRVSTVTATAATEINASGNGGGILIDATGSTALKTFNFSGDQDVEIQVSAASIDGLTSDAIAGANNATAGTQKLTLNTAAGNADVRDANFDVLDLAVDNATKSITVASGDTVQISVDQGAGTSTFVAPQTTAALNTVNFVIDDNAATTSTITLTSDALTNIKTANFSLADNMALATTFTASATTDLVFTGSKTLGVTGDVTAATINASELTGAVTATLSGGAFVSTLFTGTKADTVTVGAARTSGNFTINTGAGDDTINMIDAGAVIDGGDGDDSVVFASTADLSGQTLGLTSVEVLDIDSTSIATATFADNANNDDYTIAGTIAVGDTFAVTNEAGTTFTHTAIAGDTPTSVATALALLDASITSAGAVITVADTGAGNAAGATADSSVAITSANTLTIDGSQLNGKSISLTSSNAASGADDSLVITVTEGVTDVSNVVVDAAAVATTITADAYTAIVAATVRGTNDAETITGNGGKSFTAYGNGGVDVITGGATADNLFGGDDGDTLNGAGGADALDGGAGNDTINGDGGADVLTGGAGDDDFVFDAGESTATALDKIMDYQGAAAAGDNDTLTFGGKAGAGVIAKVAAIAATDDVSAHTADAAGVLTANQIEVVVTDGILTLAGDADKVASIDTLSEWVNVALLAFEQDDATTGAANDSDVNTLAFVFGGNTYVASAIDDLDADDTMAISNLVELTGITTLTDLDTSAAANTILVA